MLSTSVRKKNNYLQNRRGNYHLRIRIPSDLVPLLSSVELNKSLKTKDKKTAKVSALTYLKPITQTFSLLRSGYISPEQAKASLGGLLGRRGVAVVRRSTQAPQVSSWEVVSASTESFSLSTMATLYINDKQQGWSIKTKMENEASFRLLLDILGDIHIQSIDRDTARRLRDTLCILPANLYKLFPNMTIPQVIASMKSSGGSPMSITSANKYLSRFTSLMSHCIKEGKLTVNPSEGLMLKQKRRPDEERKAYSCDDLKMLMDNLPQEEDKPERYWIPLIAMYSGLRLDEICQLYTEDVKELDGVWCFDVNDSQDKKLKTLSSKRIVPVHPHLINLGFLQYVQKGRAGKKPRLWMNLQRRAADGYGSAYGKVFQRFNRKHVTTDPLKTFHSLRHLFADTLKQLGEQATMISELLGHANESITTGRYGKRYRPEVLLEVVNKVDYRVSIA